MTYHFKIMKTAHLEYKNETGKNADIGHEIDVFRTKGRWILNTSDETIINELAFGTIRFPDTEYTEWLENKVEELFKLKNQNP